MQSSGLNDPIPQPDHDQYILVVGGKPAGPFSIDELRLRKIQPGDFVKTPEMDDYKEAHEVAQLRRLFGFAKQAPPLQYFGSFDQRAIAAVIDWLIVMAVFVAIALVMAVLSTFFIAADDKSGKILIAIISIAVLALIPIAKVIYNVKMETSPKQGTYGKQLMHIRVTDLEGGPITTGKAISRNLAKYLSTLTLSVGYLMSFFNKRQQCLHDMIADTLVIKDRL